MSRPVTGEVVRVYHSRLRYGEYAEIKFSRTQEDGSVGELGLIELPVRTLCELAGIGFEVDPDPGPSPELFAEPSDSLVGRKFVFQVREEKPLPELKEIAEEILEKLKQTEEHLAQLPATTEKTVQVVVPEGVQVVVEKEAK